jgi:hypothetical protein
MPIRTVTVTQRPRCFDLKGASHALTLLDCNSRASGQPGPKKGPLDARAATSVPGGDGLARTSDRGIQSCRPCVRRMPPFSSSVQLWRLHRKRPSVRVPLPSQTAGVPQSPWSARTRWGAGCQRRHRRTRPSGKSWHAGGARRRGRVDWPRRVYRSGWVCWPARVDWPRRSYGPGWACRWSNRGSGRHGKYGRRGRHGCCGRDR